MSSVMIMDMMRQILSRQGKDAATITQGADLREIGFRSLDFSELCLRYEQHLDKELNFDAALLRKIETVDDVVNFLSEAAK